MAPRAQSPSAAPAATAPPRAVLCSGDTWSGMNPLHSTGSTEQQEAAGGCGRGAGLTVEPGGAVPWNCQDLMFHPMEDAP